jgi:hypothetical protein
MTRRDLPDLTLERLAALTEPAPACERSACLRARLRYGHNNKKFQGEDKWQSI